MTAAQVPEVLTKGQEAPKYPTEIAIDPAFPKIHTRDLRKFFAEGSEVQVALPRSASEKHEAHKVTVAENLPLRFVQHYAPHFPGTLSQSTLTLPSDYVNQYAIENILDWFTQIVNAPGRDLPKLIVPAGSDFLTLFYYCQAFEMLGMRRFSISFEKLLRRYVNKHALQIHELGEVLNGLGYTHPLNQHILAATTRVMTSEKTPVDAKWNRVKFFDQEHPTLLRGVIRDIRRVEKERKRAIREGADKP
ncbi:hypothetical protein BT63DRAFT_452243 [Microthyrium microscopicum]|uniref:Uncharacterized protein n=1 Tax=Microthyrium microscopicum TaxID=703497 RepID=A0A6A6UIX4_9PEZI|nr:hypothetical protein BT63DRAFT_452243 [Microthyrium microscopicum]